MRGTLIRNPIRMWNYERAYLDARIFYRVLAYICFAGIYSEDLFSV